MPDSSAKLVSRLDIPLLRLRAVNARPINADGRYVLYWMIASRRTTWNFALQRAAWHAAEMHRSLVVFEPLRSDYPWASGRMHRFVVEGMLDNRAALARSGVTYYPYVEPTHGAGRGLLAALAREACVVVTDDFPAFFLPQMVAAAGKRLAVRLEAVDSNGLLPLRAAEHSFPLAHAFRRFLQKTLPAHIAQPPLADPLAQLAKATGHPSSPITIDRTVDRAVECTIDRKIIAHWPPAFEISPSKREAPRARASKATVSKATASKPSAKRSANIDLDALLRSLPIDHTISRAAFSGGPVAGEQRMRDFLRDQLPRYGAERNEPDADAASGLSPYLHFGHVSAHQVFDALMRGEHWTPKNIAPCPTGSREGWWGASAAAEAFLDELITWREVGYNMCAHSPDFDQYESLPDWARTTLADHARDHRPVTYDLGQLESASTHDPLWNAAQRQLTREGQMHNYLRMLWGKKILQWSPSPREALAAMIELNNKYAVDGRDPNSYSGIFWVLGRYDRAWGPERPIFGKIRYMTSENTARKFEVRGYLARYAADGDGGTNDGDKKDGGKIAGNRRDARSSGQPA